MLSKVSGVIMMGVTLWSCLPHPIFNISWPNHGTSSSWHRKQLSPTFRDCRCGQHSPHSPCCSAGPSCGTLLPLGLEGSDWSSRTVRVLISLPFGNGNCWNPLFLTIWEWELLGSSFPHHLGMGTVRILFSSPFGQLSLFPRHLHLPQRHREEARLQFEHLTDVPAAAWGDADVVVPWPPELLPGGICVP